MSTLDDLLTTLASSHVIDLEQPRFYGAPSFPAHEPGYVFKLHRRHEPGLGRRTSASGMLYTADHSGTHIDALNHQAECLQLHGGRTVDADIQTPTGLHALGIETVAPIVTRGHLIDVAAFRGVERLPERALVSREELEAAAAAQGVAPRTGDVILVRTGNGSRWADPPAYLRGPGMSAGASRWVAEHEPVAVGCDTMAWDLIEHVDPDLGDLPGHVILLVRAGIHIVENLVLEELSRARARAFVFVCVPLKLNGATGSPVRPLAIVPAA